MVNLFRRQARLCLSKDFQRTLKHGHILKGTYCKVYRKENTYPYGRLGIIIAKKLVKLATKRHLWKRIIRESFRLNANDLAGYDIIIILKRAPQHKSQLWTALTLTWRSIYG